MRAILATTSGAKMTKEPPKVPGTKSEVTKAAIYVKLRDATDEDKLEDQISAIHKIVWSLVPYRSVSLTDFQGTGKVQIEGPVQLIADIKASGRLDHEAEDFYASKLYSSGRVPSPNSLPSLQPVRRTNTAKEEE